MKLKKYPKYKDSGRSWIGKIPDEWITEPLKYNTYAKGRIGWQNLRSDEFINEGPYLVTGMHFTKDQNIDWDNCFHISQDRFEIAPEIQLKLDDVLITKDGTIGKLAYINFLPGPTTLNSHLLVLRPLMKRYIPKYLLYILDSNIFGIFIKLNQSGTTFFGITQEAILNFPMIIPPYTHQQSIASFLDRETDKLDTLIAKQVKLIELLQEKRQAIISHAVTKGLDPNVKLKDSGLDWLGMVPEHWVITRLKYLGDAIIGLTYDPTEVVYEGEGTLVLRSSNIQQGEACFDDNVYVNKVIPEKLITRLGDILICSRNGSRNLIGKNITIDNNTVGMTFGAFMTTFRTKYYKFVSCILNSSLFEFQAGSFLTSTVNQLTTGNLNCFEVPFPPEDEQIEIANFVNIQTNKIDTLISKAQKSIELAKEHRTALISAAVTGKIDVRDMV